MKAIESKLFNQLQEMFVSVLEGLDIYLRDNRDFERFENKERQKATLATMFGSITMNRLNTGIVINVNASHF